MKLPFLHRNPGESFSRKILCFFLERWGKNQNDKTTLWCRNDQNFAERRGGQPNKASRLVSRRTVPFGVYKFYRDSGPHPTTVVNPTTIYKNRLYNGNESRVCRTMKKKFLTCFFICHETSKCRFVVHYFLVYSLHCSTNCPPRLSMDSRYVCRYCTHEGEVKMFLLNLIYWMWKCFRGGACFVV